MPQRQFRSDDTDKWKDGYGKGSDGVKTVTSAEGLPAANAGCAGTAGLFSLTLDVASSFANGQLVMIHQSRGDAQGAGNWELNKIISGGGTTSLTMAYPLMNTYQDSGISGGGESQIVEMRQYSAFTITGAAAKLFTVTGWNGNRGGILAFFCNGETKITSGGSIGDAGTQEGFRGPPGRGQGEGTGGGFGAPNEAANGNGGGGTFGDWGTGAGGGNGTAGGNGTQVIGGGPLCIGGLAKGNAALTAMVLGGAGGCGTGDTGGGYGGGVVLIISKKITVDPSAAGFFLQGGNGTGSAAQHGGGGAGAGGSVLLKGQEIILGNNLLKAQGGVGGAGGNGGAGRIHVDYSKSISGNTTPTADISLDKILADSAGGSFFFNVV